MLGRVDDAAVSFAFTSESEALAIGGSGSRIADKEEGRGSWRVAYIDPEWALWKCHFPLPSRSSSRLPAILAFLSELHCARGCYVYKFRRPICAHWVAASTTPLAVLYSPQTNGTLLGLQLQGSDSGLPGYCRKAAQQSGAVLCLHCSQGMLCQCLAAASMTSFLACRMLRAPRLRSAMEVSLQGSGSTDLLSCLRRVCHLSHGLLTLQFKAA